MAFARNRHAGGLRALQFVCLAILLIATTACTTESARQTQTAQAGGTPVTTITPAGNVLMIDDEVVVRVFVPDTEQAALYALTTERLYVFRDREWHATPSLNNGRVYLVDQNESERLFRGNHPNCAQEHESEPLDLEVSDDAGESWTVLPDGVNIRPLAFDPVFPDVLYGSDCELTISTDLGQTWTRFQPLADHEIVDLVVVGERLLVLGVSTQGKSQVRELRMTSPENPAELSDSIAQVDGVAALDADASTIVIGAPDGVRVSLDGGQTWSSSRIGLESVTRDPDADTTPGAAVTRPNAQLGIRTVEIDVSRANRIFAGTVNGLYVSQDNGGTWDRYTAIDERARVTDVQIALGGADIYVTTDAGVVTVPNP